ncbi:hypothetical protein EJ08DRAFT_709801 [Tothia fuscella]|uniref:Uncharacterized protein n=1 Tax=Tothia fuscella TaxID=1048955 RepID=A0A9P4NUI5_9PEZI|nr:hypothetical protein EJ08DRAFT_709801 [Tothia fuscella]
MKLLSLAFLVLPGVLSRGLPSPLSNNQQPSPIGIADKVIVSAAAKAPNGEDAQSSNYDIQCNSNNATPLNWDDLWSCWNEIYNRGDALCAANPSGRFCEKGAVKISGTSYFGKNTASTCRAVANGLSAIWEKCRYTDQIGRAIYLGGSNAAYGNGELIVHAQNNWVAVLPSL